MVLDHHAIELSDALLHILTLEDVGAGRLDLHLANDGQIRPALGDRVGECHKTDTVFVPIPRNLLAGHEGEGEALGTLLVLQAGGDVEADGDGALEEMHLAAMTAKRDVAQGPVKGAAKRLESVDRHGATAQERHSGIAELHTDLENLAALDVKHLIFFGHEPAIECAHAALQLALVEGE